MRLRVALACLVFLAACDGKSNEDIHITLTVAPDTPIEAAVGESVELHLAATVTAANDAKLAPTTTFRVTLEAGGALAPLEEADTVSDSFMDLSEVNALRTYEVGDNMRENGGADVSVTVRCAREGDDSIAVTALTVDTGDAVVKSDVVTIPVTCTAAMGVACGGDQCDANDYCDFSLDSCAATADSTASCAVIPPGDCTAGGDSPVCGCDGQVYDNIICAQQGGTDVSFAGGCTPPAGTFACGHTFCDPSTSYCDTREAPTAICMALPAACTANGATPTCDCLTNKCPPNTTLDSCDDTDGHITVICLAN